MAAFSVPLSAGITFVFLYMTGGLGTDPSRRGGASRIYLPSAWFERLDWTTAIFLFVIVFIVLQIIFNLDLIRNPPGNLFGSKTKSDELSISLKDK